MTVEKTNEITEYLKSNDKFASDLSSYIRCCNMVRKFERCDAIALLQNIIERYKDQINQLGFFMDGIGVIYGINYDELSDLQIKDQLVYIGQRIPVYVLIREGEHNLVNDWLNRFFN